MRPTQKSPNTPKSTADRIEAMDHALKVSELASSLSWSPSLVCTLARSGAVIRTGGTLRFDRFYTAEWLRSLSAN